MTADATDATYYVYGDDTEHSLHAERPAACTAARAAAEERHGVVFTVERRTPDVCQTTDSFHHDGRELEEWHRGE